MELTKLIGLLFTKKAVDINSLFNMIKWCLLVE